MKQQPVQLNTNDLFTFIENQKMDQEEKKRCIKCFFQLCSFPYSGRIMVYTQIETLSDIYSVPEKYSGMTYFL